MLCLKRGTRVNILTFVSKIKFKMNKKSEVEIGPKKSTRRPNGSTWCLSVHDRKTVFGPTPKFSRRRNTGMLRSYFQTGKLLFWAIIEKNYFFLYVLVSNVKKGVGVGVAVGFGLEQPVEPPLRPLQETWNSHLDSISLEFKANSKHIATKSLCTLSTSTSIDSYGSHCWRYSAILYVCFFVVVLNSKANLNGPAGWLTQRFSFHWQIACFE